MKENVLWFWNSPGSLFFSKLLRKRAVESQVCAWSLQLCNYNISFFECDKTKASSVNNFSICQNLFELLDSELKTLLEKFERGSYVFVESL